MIQRRKAAITFLALSHAKYADSEPDSFFIAHFLYNCYNICVTLKIHEVRVGYVRAAS